MVQLNNLEIEEQIKPKPTEWQEKIKIEVEINERKTKKTVKTMNLSLVFEKINNIDRS